MKPHIIITTSRCQLKFRESCILRRKTRFVQMVEQTGGNIENKNLMIYIVKCSLDLIFRFQSEFCSATIFAGLAAFGSKELDVLRPVNQCGYIRAK